jgi:pimeloyl-ACP methyl ester carboxylesterase
MSSNGNAKTVIHYVRRGHGQPLLLVHGLGSTWRTWEPILDALAAGRDVLAVDLPAHGGSPSTPGADTFAGLVDAVEEFLRETHLDVIDAAGVSMGARIVLDLARRGSVRAAVALDPGGFWRGWERTFFSTTISASIRVVRALQPVMPTMTNHALGRAALLAQLSAHPARLPSDLVLQEMRSFAATSTFDALVRDLAYGPEQTGATSTAGPITIGWGRKDRLCLPRQADRAAARFPSARLHWFEDAGHYPHWDSPEETVRVILESTGAS